MMEISHLYHDAAFGDPTLELDVKEQLKTREVNAREERNLQRMRRSYDREMDICEKNTAWERWKVGQSLQGIWERSPRLDKCLAMEKARIEALERSILFRNFPRVKTHTSDFSMTYRSVSRVTLNPLQDHKKKQQSKNSKKKEKAVRETGDNNNNNNNPIEGNERGIGRQADFVRRSEHSIKALAKLNWKQQNRRRDHEKFKEDLYFHSKHVFEKAKVILKGRPDIDVENLHTDLESIFLPPVKKPPNFNHKPQFKTSNSNLYEKNVLRLGESVQRKQPPYLSPLAPVSENYEPAGCDLNQTKSEQLSAVNDSRQSINSTAGADSDVHKCSIPADGDSSMSMTEHSDNLSSSKINLSTSVTNSKCDTSSDSENNRLPDLSRISTSQTNLSKLASQESAMTENHQPNTSPPPPKNEGVNTNDFTDSNSNIAPIQSHTEQHQQNVQTPAPSHSFSPSTSISQVIIEETEEDLEKSNATSGEEICPDINNNSMPMHDDQGIESHNDTGTNSAYTMACTTGLPQIWKQAKKPKEVATPEVSASAIARKHKRKRRDRW